MSILTNYKHTTYDEAREKGVKVKAVLNGIKYTGYEYEGYFYHYIPTVGTCKILSKYCDNVRRNYMSNKPKYLTPEQIRTGNPTVPYLTCSGNLNPDYCNYKFIKKGNCVQLCYADFYEGARFKNVNEMIHKLIQEKMILRHNRITIKGPEYSRSPLAKCYLHQGGRNGY